MRAFYRLFPLLLLLLAPAAPAQLEGGPDPFGDNIPSVEEAFDISVSLDKTARTLWLDIDIADNCYLYRDKLAVQLEGADGNTLQTFDDVELPPGKSKVDEFFGEVQVYYDSLSLPLPAPELPSDATLVVDFQGCVEDLLCYPPETRRFPVETLGGTGDDKSAAAKPENDDESGFIATLFSSDAHAFNDWMRGHSPVMVMLLFFAGGLLLAFTPCVFPMIPILSGIIAGEKQPSARRGFTLSLAYVLGVAVPYTLAGLLVALFGAGLNLQYWLQQPAAIITAAVIFVALALAMFGLYELQLPAALRERLHRAGPDRGGSLPAAAVMGVISALVVSPCVTPILAGALVYVAGTGDAVIGALSLFAMALGMGVPLIILGTSEGRLLPRVGNWMVDIRRFFGVLLLGVAIWLLDRIIPDSITLGLYGVLLAVYGIQLGALEPATEDTSRLRRGIALVLALYGAVMVVGAAGGGTDPLQPLAGDEKTTQPSASTDTGAWQYLEGHDNLNAALRQARAQGRPVLVDFFAEWCVSCRVLEEETLNHPEVLDALADFALIRVDITAVNRENRQIMKDHGVMGLPTLLFLAPDGDEVPESRVLGEMSPERFLKHLKKRVFTAI